jgi:hypothetical protein
MAQVNMYTTLLTSVVVQFITGVIEFAMLFIHLPSKFLFLRQLMLLEVIVQFIEGSFYLYWLFHFKQIANITPKRYFDWVITTPTMLVNLIFYLIYLKSFEEDKSETLNFFDLFKQEFNTISVVLVLNWLMLLFGYLGETKVISTMQGVILGFIPFIIYYYIIYKNYANLTKDGYKLYFYFLFFLSLYGIAAIMPYKLKNMCYNILDLFAKNFFGIFLTYLILKNKA